ncbi:hypothetical protein Q7P37_011633 [Cladosporium fusiforme]
MLGQLPWSGLLALLLGFGCGVVALTVALVSNGKPLDYWHVSNYSVQPTVLLAILVTFANALLGYAFASGITIHWWSSALAGRTLRQLHASQSRGDSLMALLTLRPIFNAVTVASVFTILLLMDQPLFQRGIRVVPRSSESQSLSIPISSSPIQLGATGIIHDHSDPDRPELFHPLFPEVLRQYRNRDPIQIALPECKRGCEFDVVTTGWEVDCIEWETSYRFMDYSDYEEYSQDTSRYSGPLRVQPAFSVNITYHPDDDTQSWFHSFRINISVMRKATHGGNGTMHWRNCTLTEALVRYPVEVSNNILRLKAMTSGPNRTTQRILRSTETSGQKNRPSTFGGIWKAMESQFAAQTNITFVAAWSSISVEHMASITYLQAPSNSTLDDINYNFKWSDPTDDIISMAHELTLRTAIATTNTLVVTNENGHLIESTPNLLTHGQHEIGSPNLTLVNRTTHQDVEVAMSFDETVYEVQPQWLAGAFVAIIMASLSIMPTYWGWWRLGRPVSMSPLEIAKAFDAPLMQRADPNGTAGDHLRTVGDTRVRYGSHATVAEQLESDLVEKPSYQPKVGSTLDVSVVEHTESNNLRAESFSHEHMSAPNTPIAGSAGSDDEIELQTLPPNVSSAAGTRYDPEIPELPVVSSDPSESNTEPRMDSSCSEGVKATPASARIHARIEMRMRFAEE